MDQEQSLFEQFPSAFPDRESKNEGVDNPRDRQMLTILRDEREKDRFHVKEENYQQRYSVHFPDIDQYHLALPVLRAYHAEFPVILIRVWRHGGLYYPEEVFAG